VHALALCHRCWWSSAPIHKALSLFSTLFTWSLVRVAICSAAVLQCTISTDGGQDFAWHFGSYYTNVFCLWSLIICCKILCVLWQCWQCCHHGEVIVRIHRVHLMNVEQCRPSDLAMWWAVRLLSSTPTITPLKKWRLICWLHASEGIQITACIVLRLAC